MTLPPGDARHSPRHHHGAVSKHLQTPPQERRQTSITIEEENKSTI
jgi:hypothetical protein